MHQNLDLTTWNQYWEGLKNGQKSYLNQWYEGGELGGHLGCIILQWWGPISS